MGRFRAFAAKSAVLAAVVIVSTAVGAAPGLAEEDRVATPQASSFVPPMVGLPYVGSELTLGIAQFQKCKTEEAPSGFTLEWFSDGVPLPPERQGEFLKLIPADRGHRISMTVSTTCATPQVFHSRETPAIEASNRAMGWTGRGNFELLGRTNDGDLVLYPRIYEPEWIYWGPGTELLQFHSSWDEPRVVGSGWNIFDIVFSPGDFDGDGNNDVLGRDSAGNLHLYPGDGAGGWLAPSRVGSGWQIFDKIIAAGDSTGDGTPDIFARDRSGFLYQYPTDGHGGWNSPLRVGHGWDEMTEISSAGPYTKSYSTSRNDLIGYNHGGDLFVYANIGAQGDYSLFNQGQIGSEWDIFKDLI